MNSAIVTLNDWARQGPAFAWTLFWQSSLLIGFMFGLEFALRRKLRASVRYAFWLVILLKLLLPPSLALPSGLGWWVRPSARTPAIHKESAVLISYKSDQRETLQTPQPPKVADERPALSPAAWGLLAWAGVAFAFLSWMLIRWAQVAREARKASTPPDWLQTQLDETCSLFGWRCHVGLRVLERPESPAISGVFRPILLVPRKLIEQLVPAEMRAVLLHELMHFRRGDIWVNCAQALLQIVFWWHPLLWLANARIRRVREEAVDDAVMVALRSEADIYAPTLLAVARLAMRRSLISLGLVGILESRTSLRQRIERLVDFQPPAKAGLTLASLGCVLTFAAVALPMGQAPVVSERDLPAAASIDNLWPDPRFAGYAEIKLEPQFLIADEASLRVLLPSIIGAGTPLVIASNQVAEIESRLHQANAQPYTSAEPLSFGKFSGGTFTWLVGGFTNNGVNYLTRNAGEQRTIVIGAESRFLATQPDWLPLELTVVPWSEDSSVRCQVELGFAGSSNSMRQAEATIPPAGGLLWATVAESNPRKYEIVLLEEKSGLANQEPRGASASPTVTTTTTGAESTPPPTDLVALRRILANSSMSNAASVFTNVTAAKGKESPPNSPVGLWKLKGILTPNGSEPMAIINQGVYHLGDEIEGYKVIRITGDEVWFQGPRDKERLGFDRVQSGNALLERGELSQAGAQFEKALEEDPANQQAQYYVNQVRRAIYRKLRDTQLSTVSFDHTPLREVLDVLSSYTRDPKSGNNTVNFAYNQQPEDIGEIRITIQPALKAIRLLDAIDAVAKVAPTPLQYSLTPTGVMFARKSNEPGALYTRIIKVDPGTFMGKLRWVNRGYQDGRSDQQEVRDYFAAIGVDLNPPKSIFFNDREGTLLIRAALPDLDKIEHSVAELNQLSQINFKVKFVTSSVELGAHLWRAVGLTNAPDRIGSGFSAVLTPAQAAVLSKAFETSPGEVVNEASVTTMSGRETQIQTVDLKTIVTNINPRALTPPGISAKESKNDLYQTATVPFGPTLNINALVQADGLHIQLVTDFQLTEPVSSGNSTNNASIYIDGKRHSVSQPSLHSRIAKAASNLVIADGETLVLEAEMLDEPASSLSTPDSKKKCLFALVTPVIIDPAGNRLHPEPPSSQPALQK